MTRRSCLLIAVAACGCGRRPADPGQELPQTLEGGWRRTAVHTIAPANYPETVNAASVTWAVSGAYEGPGRLRAEVYAMKSSAGGLDAVQRWRAAADTVVFYTDRYFVVVRWQQAERSALSAFVRDLEKALGDRK